MRYGKLNENNEVVFAQLQENGGFICGDSLIFNPSASDYASEGYYPVEFSKEIGVNEIKDGVLIIYTGRPRSLRQVIDEKIEALYAYDESDAVNEFTLGGVPMWVGLEQRKNMKQSLDVLDDEEDWTYWYGLQPFTFNVATFKQMLKTIERYAILCKNRTFEHEKNIRELETIEEVDNYDFTVGYPDKIIL